MRRHRKSRARAGFTVVEVAIGATLLLVLGAAAVVWLDGDTITDAGVGLAAVGAEHFVSPAAEAALRGQPASEETVQAAADAAKAECEPTTDQRGPAEYKRHLAGELTARALRRAIARAKGDN